MVDSVKTAVSLSFSCAKIDVFDTNLSVIPFYQST